MKARLKHKIIFSMMEKLRKNEPLTLSEKGMYDILWGKGERPEGFSLPKWMKKNAR